MKTSYTFIENNNIIESFAKDELSTFNVGDIYISHVDIPYYIIDIKKVFDGRYNKITVLVIIEELPDEDRILEILRTI